MKLVKTKHFPFGAFKAIALWPFVFMKGKVTDTVVRHESIHCKQQIETLLLGFYLLYGIDWLIELVRCACDKERGQIQDPRYKKRKLIHRVAHTVMFEQEAYSKQDDVDYLKDRKHFAWLHYFK